MYALLIGKQLTRRLKQPQCKVKLTLYSTLVVLTFRCGWRTWQGRPVFSQHNLNSDKHKFERYMPKSSGAFFAGSVFSPVTCAPCPVLMFRERSGAIEGGDSDNNNGRREFLAHGSMNIQAPVLEVWCGMCCRLSL